MRKRDWLATLGAGLCVGLMPACGHRTHALPDGDLGHLRTQSPAAPSAQVAAADSPYHPRPALAGPTHDPHLAQARYAAQDRREPAPLVSTEQAPPPPKPPEDPPLLAALRCYLNKRPDEVRTWLERYDRPQQDLLRGLLALAVRLAEPKALADPRAAADITAGLEQLQTPLRPLLPLQIPAMCFCKWIEKYGVYEPLPEQHHFRPGEWVQLYVEVQHFTSESSGRSWTARLASTVEIRDFEEGFVWRTDFSDQDRCLAPRRDYFSNFRFRVPDRIPPGAYTLSIQVKDVPTGRTVRRSLDFRVASAPLRGS